MQYNLYYILYSHCHQQRRPRCPCSVGFDSCFRYGGPQDLAATTSESFWCHRAVDGVDTVLPLPADAVCPSWQLRFPPSASLQQRARGVRPRDDSILDLHSRPSVCHSVSWLSTAFVRWWNADLRPLQSIIHRSTPAPPIWLHRRRRQLDAIKPATTEYRENRSSVVLVKPTPTSITSWYGTCWLQLRQAVVIRSRPRYLPRFWRQHVNPRHTDSIEMFRHCSVNCGQSNDLCQLDTFQGLVVSLVLSRLDCCKATLAGLPANLLSQLQAAMNAGARLIFNANRRQHVTPLLCQLHWLRVQERITFKLATLMFQCVNGTAPGYISGRCEMSRRLTRPQTPALSCIIFTCHSSYPTFCNWCSRLRPLSGTSFSKKSDLPLHYLFQTSAENSSFRLCLTLVK